MKKQNMYGVSLVACVLMACSVTTVGAYDEYLNNYTLGEVVVSADRVNNQFGDTITEQSYYRTGGDVKVITRDEIEKRHYSDVTDAIKRIPGITFQNPGYRGGEYGYQFYNNGVAINGDTRVIVLVNGRRVDNAASTRLSSSSTKGSKGTGVNLDQITSIDNIEKIEVIKGPGASAYGSDATGGVINIITRKGTSQAVGNVDVAMGNWDKRKYEVSYGGPISKDGTTTMFFTANKVKSGDTKYIDGITGQEGTLAGGRYDEKGLSFTVNKDLGNDKSIEFSYNFKSGKDGYPIATPNLKYWNENDWKDIIFGAVVGKIDENGKVIGAALRGDYNLPGYHNLYALDGNYGSYSHFDNRDVELKYTFNVDKGMPSFVRLYNQDHYLASKDKYFWVPNGMTKQEVADKYKAMYPNGATVEERRAFAEKYLAPFPGGDPKALKEWIESTGGYAGPVNEWYIEKNKGIQIEYAKSFNDKHDLIVSGTYDWANNDYQSVDKDNKVKTSTMKRNTLRLYAQDKIHMNENWDLTPTIRYVRYSDYSKISDAGVKSSRGGAVSALTGALNTEYKFNDTMSGYLGITNVHRPLRAGDYVFTKGLNGPLKDEKGMVYTMGLTKHLDDFTTLGVNYSYTYMTNAIATLPIYKDNADKPEIGVMNAKEKMQAFNVTLDKQINENWTLSAAYTHMSDKWSAKSPLKLPDNYETILGANASYASDINTLMNKLVPKHRISVNLSYEKGKVYTGLLTNFYLGNNTSAFTSSSFIVLDWSLNYKFNKDMTGYILINNLTNTAYQTSFNYYNGIDSSSMPARSYMVGLKYTF